MKKLIATISIIAALGAGAIALNSVLPAGALGISSSPSSSSSSDAAACSGRKAKGKDVLDNLVSNGTITQAQEDAIIKAMADAFASGGSHGGRADGLRVRVLEGMLQVSADKIGVSVDDLKSALKSGQSVADVAKAHSVNPSDVVTAIVDAGNTKLAQAVTDGKLTQAQADQLKGRLPQAADRFVNHTRGAC
jgi:tape measure domain-containing protein